MNDIVDFMRYRSQDLADELLDINMKQMADDLPCRIFILSEDPDALDLRTVPSAARNEKQGTADAF